jgi:hypothetical protein
LPQSDGATPVTVTVSAQDVIHGIAIFGETAPLQIEATDQGDDPQGTLVSVLISRTTGDSSQQWAMVIGSSQLKHRTIRGEFIATVGRR